MAKQSTPTLIFPGMGGLYEGLTPWAYPIMRFCAGLFLAPHGAQKLFGMFGGNINGTIGFFSKIGLEPATLLAYLVGVVEFFGGLAVAFGLLTRISAAASAIILFMAAFYVHMANGYFWNKAGYEYPLLWAVLMCVIFIRGGGEKSIDHVIGKEF